MKFKDLNKEDIALVKSVYFDKNLSYDDKLQKLARFFGKSQSTVKRWISSLNLTSTVSEDSDELKQAKNKKFDKTKKRFLITWAQNATPVHKKFFANMEAYAKHIDAGIHVIAGRYKNPTSVFSAKSKAGDFWVEDVLPYLDANRHDIHKYVSILSDIKIQPTAVNPMSSLEGITGVNSCVIGHPRVQMEVIPALQGHKPKVMLTTGACTVRNYIDSKAGKKGEFHHTLGFVIVEIKNRNTFFVRQVTADGDGSFRDLYFEVKDENVSQIEEIAAAILGDIHLGHTDNEVMKATQDLLGKLKPEVTVMHDIFDGYSISHHDRDNPVIQYQKQRDGRNSLKNEVNNMLEWLREWKDRKVVIVRSNHDDFVDRWIINADWKKDPVNASEYMEYTKVLLDGKAPQGIIPYIINQHYPKIITLGRDDSYKVFDWELGVHGDVGQNGSRGSLEQFRKLNTKIVVGHYHTPGRKDGALAVGTSTVMRMGYNIGASGWMNSHVIIHTNGKAQHINFIDGEYTTL